MPHLMQVEPSSLVPLGAHSVRVVDDSVFFVARGAITGDDMRALIALFAEVRGRRGQLFMFYDARQGTGLEPAARRIATQSNAKELGANLHVAFGASFAVRVLVTMIYRAQALLGRNPTPMHIVETEAEALALFESERARIRAERAVTM